MFDATRLGVIILTVRVQVQRARDMADHRSLFVSETTARLGIRGSNTVTANHAGTIASVGNRDTRSPRRRVDQVLI